MPFRTVADAGNSRTLHFNTRTPTDVRGISQPNVPGWGYCHPFRKYFLADNTPTRHKNYGRNRNVQPLHKQNWKFQSEKMGYASAILRVGVHVILFFSKFGTQYAKYRRGTYPKPFSGGMTVPQTELWLTNTPTQNGYRGRVPLQIKHLAYNTPTTGGP